MQTTRSASNNRVGLFARCLQFYHLREEDNRGEDVLILFITTTRKLEEEKYSEYDNRLEEDNLEEDKDEDRNVPFYNTTKSCINLERIKKKTVSTRPREKTKKRKNNDARDSYQDDDDDDLLYKKSDQG